MSKQSIKATIDANIKQNGVQAITGQIMNSVLNQMVDNLAEEASTTEKLTELESEVSQLGQEVIGINEYQEYTGSIDTTFIDTSSTAKYKVVRVNGGEHLFVESTTFTRIAILSDFTYNPDRPYDLIFATGETARRQVKGSYIEVDLPNDARYILLQTVYDYGIGRVTIKDFVLDGENYLPNIKDNLYDIAENAYTPYFSSEKDFSLTDKDSILALKNALIKCAWYSVPSVTKIGIFTYQLTGGSFLLWFANCDELADDAVITQDKVFAAAQAEYANNKDVQKFDIIQEQQIVGYVIVDIGLLVSSRRFVQGSTPTTYKNSGLSFIEIDTEQQIEDVRAEANLALKQSSPVKELTWSVKFNGETNSYITPNNNIVLSQDGDSLQIEVSNVLSASMDSGGYAFSKGTGGDSVRGIFISKGGISVRSDDGTWVFNSVIADSSVHLKIKLEYSSGNILLYINEQLNSTYTGQKTITLIGFGNGAVPQYPTYWRGIIDSIQYNSDALSFYTDFTFGLGAVLYRANGFLTNEQAELLGGQGAELYISKTASVLNLYKKLPDGNYVKYPLEYRQKGFTENQYPSYYDNWGIGKPMLCSFNGTMVEQVELFSGAEAELALTTPDAKDGSYTYVGGAMHGFENIIVDVNNGRSIRMYVNGILIGESDVIALMPVQSVEVIQKSTLCPAYTNENPFADILKHWYFNRDGLKIATTISITKSVTVAQTMMGMLGVLRHWNSIVTNDYLTNKAIKNNLPFTIYDVEDGWEDVAANSGLKNRDVKCTEIKLCGEKGFGFALKIQSDDTKQTGGMFMSTNGGQPYNKTYFDLTGAITSLNIGDTLEATQHWVIE